MDSGSRAAHAPRNDARKEFMTQQRRPKARHAEPAAADDAFGSSVLCCGRGDFFEAAAVIREHS
jgi:hypothetical protein